MYKVTIVFNFQGYSQTKKHTSNDISDIFTFICQYTPSQDSIGTHNFYQIIVTKGWFTVVASYHWFDEAEAVRIEKEKSRRSKYV